MLYQTEGDKNLVRGLKAKILKGVSISVLGRKKGSRISGVLRKYADNNSPLNLLMEYTLAVALSSSQGILNNLAKAGLISPLVDSGVASLEAVYLLVRGRVNKKGALNHIIKEATGTINSSVAVLGTLLILRAFSYIPTPGRIAILVVAKIAVKKLQNRR
ncbi:MAG: hypothetical protein ACREOW_17855 [Thermodesulfobacteriota bacterium]